MYKHEGYKVGQKIRAYDFKPLPGRGDCFLEGEITEAHAEGTKETPYAHYIVAVTRDVCDGTEIADFSGRVNTLSYVPMECTFLEYDSRVSLVGGQS